MKDWRRLSEPEVLAKGFGKQFLRVQFEHPKTGKADDYFLFHLAGGKDTEPGGGVVTMVVTTDNEVVLLREFMQGINRAHVWLGGGLRKRGEASETASARELEEEAGYRADSIIPLGPIPFVPRHCTTSTDLFLATGCRQVVAAHPDPDEDIEVFRVPLDRCIAMVMAGEIDDPFTTAAVFRALPHLGYSVVKR